LSTIDATQVL